MQLLILEIDIQTIVKSSWQIGSSRTDLNVKYFYKVKIKFTQPIVIKSILVLYGEMQTDIKPIIQRPQVQSYSDVSLFVFDMVNYRKKTEKSFSVMTATKNLRKVSSALVSLIIQKKRKLTIERCEEFSKLLALTPAEKIYFKNWIQQNENPDEQKEVLKQERKNNRTEAAMHLLNDWLNVYVKDCFRIKAIQKNPQLLYQELGSIASKKRIDQSLQFLLKEGYLRKTLDQHIVVETSLVTTENPIPSQKIRAFHKAALSIAKQNIDLFLTHERFANTMVLDLNPERYQQLTEMIREFSKNLQDFAAVEHQNGDKLYQVTINLSPTGGRVV